MLYHNVTLFPDTSERNGAAREVTYALTECLRQPSRFGCGANEDRLSTHQRDPLLQRESYGPQLLPVAATFRPLSIPASPGEPVPENGPSGRTPVAFVRMTQTASLDMDKAPSFSPPRRRRREKNSLFHD